MIVLYNQITGDTLNLTTDLKGYFFGIVRNIWNSQLRKKRKTIELEPDLMDENNNPDEDNERMFERIISRAFKQLKPDLQTVLNLFYEGFTYERNSTKDESEE